MSEITKRRVTMRRQTTTICEDGSTMTIGHEATDFVRPDILPAYIQDAATRWETVEVSGEPDAGPGGYDGPTFVPPTLNPVGALPAATTKEK